MYQKLKSLVLLPILITLHCFASDDPTIKFLSIEQGLSNNTVTSIYQDCNGFIWFGTYDGLNRYDGYSFKVYRNVFNDSTTLNDNHITVISQDSRKQMWVGNGKGLNIYNAQAASFSSVSYLRWRSTKVEPFHNAVRAIQKVNAANLMAVGTQYSGLLVFEKNAQVGRQIPFLEWEGHQRFYDANALAFDSLRQVVWVFVQQYGLCKYDLKKQLLTSVNKNIKQADCLKLDKKGDLWLGNDQGLFCYNIASNTYAPASLSGYKVVNLFEDRQSRLWIATDGGGVWSIAAPSKNPVPFVSKTGSPLLNSNAVYGVYEDRAGGRWIGTLRGGINVVQPGNKPFRHVVDNVAGQQQLASNFILSFGAGEKNNVWIGTDGAGLKYWDRQAERFTTYVHQPGNPHSISSNFVTNILRDSQNDLWVTTWFGGVNRLKHGSKQFERFDCLNTLTGTVENNAWLIYEDAQKTLWASTTNDGTLYQFNRGTNRFDLFNPDISNVQCLAEDSKGTLWAGNYTSVIRIDKLRKQYSAFEIGTTARCLHEDKAGNFWVGTNGSGLLLFNRTDGSYKRFTTTDGLPSNTILRILEDKEHNLWLSTYNGLCKFNPAQKSFRVYAQSDGLQSNQFSFNAAAALPSGEFLFGGIKGFNIFFPDSIYDRKETPPVFLTGVRIDNHPVNKDYSYGASMEGSAQEKMVLSYDQTILSLDFVALDYFGAEKVKYAYILEGWDKDWHYVQNARTANYSRLHEGTYQFLVKATNLAGSWSEPARLITIVVLPPWYRTWWAYLIYLIAFGSIVYGYLTYTKRRQRLMYEIKLAHLEKERERAEREKSQADFEKEKAERERSAAELEMQRLVHERERDINEKRQSFFTSISHEFRTPLTLILNPIKDLLTKDEASAGAKEELNIVYRNARRLLSLVDQLLLFRKAESGADRLNSSRFDLERLCKEVYLAFVQKAKAEKIAYHFEGTGNQLEYCGDPEKLEIIFYNLLSNAFKYTPRGGEIRFGIKEVADGLMITVADNGSGIPKETGDSLFEKFSQAPNAKAGFGIGLYLVKHFAEAHKGKVQYESELGKGTIFTVSLPLTKVQLGEQANIPAQVPEAPATVPLLKGNYAELEGKVERLKSELGALTTDTQSILLVDDDAQIRQYMARIFKDQLVIYEAESGEEGLEKARQYQPGIIISDVGMAGISGIELCKLIKEDSVLSHVPVILLTGSSAAESKLAGIEGGADDYITKPFEKDLLVARVNALLKSRTSLQQYFYNEITLQKNTLKISAEYKEFLDNCIAVVERHLDDEQFSIQTLAKALGMSYSKMNKKIKAVSGQPANAFVRFIRLRKAAELFINSDYNVNETAFQVGIKDIKYFREQFNKLFGMNPSEYIDKYRKTFGKNYHLNETVLKINAD